MESNKDRLRKKIKSKKSQRKPNAKPDIDLESSGDLMGMLSQVNSMLKNNPDMIKKVSKCVNNIMKDQSLVETLTSQINKVNLAQERSSDDCSTSGQPSPGKHSSHQTECVDTDWIVTGGHSTVGLSSKVHQDQTLESKDSLVSTDALSNESKQ